MLNAAVQKSSFGASQEALVVKNQPANAGDIRDVGSFPRLIRFPGGGHGNPLRYSCLEIPMNRGAWWARKGSDMPEATEHACIGKSESMKYQKR